MGDDSFRPNHVYVTKDGNNVTKVELDHVDGSPERECFRHSESHGYEHIKSDGKWGYATDPNKIPHLVRSIVCGYPSMEKLKEVYPHLTIVDNIAERATKKK